jgi:hypothetical protein
MVKLPEPSAVTDPLAVPEYQTFAPADADPLMEKSGFAFMATATIA